MNWYGLCALLEKISVYSTRSNEVIHKQSVRIGNWRKGAVSGDQCLSVASYLTNIPTYQPRKDLALELVALVS
jgi:hypothetical protein